MLANIGCAIRSFVRGVIRDWGRTGVGQRLSLSELSKYERARIIIGTKPTVVGSYMQVPRTLTDGGRSIHFSGREALLRWQQSHPSRGFDP